MAGRAFAFFMTKRMSPSKVGHRSSTSRNMLIPSDVLPVSIKDRPIEERVHKVRESCSPRPASTPAEIFSDLGAFQPDRVHRQNQRPSSPLSEISKMYDSSRLDDHRPTREPAPRHRPIQAVLRFQSAR